MLKLAPALAFILLVASWRSSLFGTAPYQLVAKRLLSGQNYEGDINFDERAFQLYMARRLPAGITTLIAGSSRTMQLDGYCFDGKSYNASVSGAMISDVAAIVGEFERGRNLKHVVIAADPWMLNAHEQTAAWNADNIKRIHAAPAWLRAQFQLGLTPHWQDFSAAARAVVDPYREALAPSTFQAAWTPQERDARASFLKQPDGSLTYPDVITGRSELEAAAEARKDVDAHLASTYAGFDQVDPFLAQAFEALTADLKSRGVRVTLVLAPFHPIYCQRAATVLTAAETYFRAVASKHGYEVIGSYIGAPASDFFDGVHLKKAALQRLYGCPGSVTHWNDMEIRELKTNEEMKGVVELQRIVWGAADIDILAPLSLRAAVEAGNLLLGAFDGDLMVGFMYGFLGYLHGQVELHSDMTGLRPEYRDRGLGYRLKLFQRDWALARGIELVTWTFDPLRSRNAYFNFHKLGAISDSYRVNFYGEDSTSFLHQNSTDRLWVSWHLNSGRVRECLSGVKPGPMTAPALISIGTAQEPVKHEVDATVRQVTIEIPLEPDELEIGLASHWREVTRAAFLERIAAGFVVTDAVQGRYLLEDHYANISG